MLLFYSTHGSQWWFNHCSLLFSYFMLCYKHSVLTVWDENMLLFDCFFKLWVSFSTFDVSGLILSSKLFVNSLSHGLWLCQSNTQANENQRLADNTSKGMSNSLEVVFHCWRLPYYGRAAHSGTAQMILLPIFMLQECQNKEGKVIFCMTLLTVTS